MLAYGRRQDLCTWIMFGNGIVDRCLEKFNRPLGLVVMEFPPDH